LCLNNGNEKNCNENRNSLNKSTSSINSDKNSKELKEKASKIKELKTMVNYKTCYNFNKKKNLDKNTSPPKSAKKEASSSKIMKNKNDKHQTINPDNPKSERSVMSKLGLSKSSLKGISNSLILKKNDKKGKKEMASVFLPNYKVVPNKSKRLEKDLKFKYSLDYIAKDSSIKSQLIILSTSIISFDFVFLLFILMLKSSDSSIKS